ncbi:TPA: hypothetical protein NKQ82_004633 [Vibrio parahaemolyticus]|nr:hypothetical protein [Vibrio parahaemolyticus]
MKVKQLVEKLQKLDQDGQLLLFMRDNKRPHLGSGTITSIKDIDIFTSVDQDLNEGSYALDIKKDE